MEILQNCFNRKNETHIFSLVKIQTLFGLGIDQDKV